MPNFDDIDLAIIVIGLLGILSIILLVVFKEAVSVTDIGAAMAPFVTAISGLAKGKPKT